MSHEKGKVDRLEETQLIISRRELERLSHDFHSPLNIIIGFSELMLDEASGCINADQRSALNDILTSGRRLLHLVDEVFSPSACVSSGTAGRKRAVKTAEIYYQR